MGYDRFKPLKKGKYRVIVDSELNPLVAAMNGHRFLMNPDLTAESDGEWVIYKSGCKTVYQCNAIYANANFTHEKV